MAKKWLIATAALMLIASGASAEDTKTVAAPVTAEKPADTEAHHGWHHRKPKTLEEARAHAKKKYEELEKMTPQQWDEKQKQNAQRREKKWKAMSPEARAEYMKKKEERSKGHKKEGAEATPAAAPATAPVTEEKK